MKINLVQSARKPVECGKCRSAINKGDPYRWAKPRYGRRKIRCLKSICNFLPSDLSSAKTASILDAIEDARESIDLADDYASIKEALSDCAQVSRDVAQEYQDANNAWAGGQGRDDWQEKVDVCESFADELEDWEYGDLTEEEDVRQQVKDEEEDEPEQGESEDEFYERIEALEDQRWDQVLQEMRDEAHDLLSAFEG